jgi:hypothetical protein
LSFAFRFKVQVRFHCGIVRGVPGVGFGFGTKARISGAKRQRAGMKLILGDETSRRAKISQKGKKITGISWSGRPISSRVETGSPPRRTERCFNLPAINFAMQSFRFIKAKSRNQTWVAEAVIIRLKN